MDETPYHAHVVRVAEPTVVANDLSLLSAYHLEALLDAGYSPSSLATSFINPEQPSNALSLPKLDDRPEAECIGEHSTDHSGQEARPDNPRSESSDLLAAEDGRRVRFALSDGSDDHFERLRLPHHSHGTIAQLREPRALQNGRHSLQDDESSRSARQAQPSPSSRTTPSGFNLDLHLQPPAPPLLPFYPGSHLTWDENLIAVDDSRRNYNFADFMDHWLSGQEADGEITALKPPSDPCLWRRPQQTYVRTTNDSGQPERDVQGLLWQEFGVERSSALRARRRLRPQHARTKMTAHATDSILSQQAIHFEHRAFAPKPRARFGHYQLRNLIAPGKGRNVYCAAGSRVTKASLACPSAENTVLDLAKPSRSALPFKITCLASSSQMDSCGDDILLAGGFNGEYALCNLDVSVSERPVEGIVSHARDGIVNHIRAFQGRRSGALQAAFSCNDHHVRIMDVSTQQFASTFEYSTAINCSAMSTDKRLRVLAHDGTDTLITNAENGEIIARLDAHTDFAFACDWSPCGRYVATGAEDGKVVIWDARNWSLPIHQLDSVMSCARSLHFTDDGALIMAESEDVVSIVETADFRLRQDLQFFGCIAGVALLNDGDEMAVANADETVGGLMSLRRLDKGLGSSSFGQCVGAGRGQSKRRRERDDAVVHVLV